jgi:hypothetical protein
MLAVRMLIVRSLLFLQSFLIFLFLRVNLLENGCSLTDQEGHLRVATGSKGHCQITTGVDGMNQGNK